MQQNLNSIIHDFIYCYIKSKYKEPHINKTRLLLFIKTILRVPKSMDTIILQEMETRGLIKKINHQTYFIFNDTHICKCSINRIKKYKDFVFW